MGFHVQGNGDITYTEWAPNALRAYVIGDFSRLQCVAERRNIADTHLHQMAGTEMLRR